MGSQSNLSSAVTPNLSECFDHLVRNSKQIDLFNSFAYDFNYKQHYTDQLSLNLDFGK